MFFMSLNIDAENIGVDSRFERAESTPDLTECKAGKNAIYVTPTLTCARPKGSPPTPPGADCSQKKPASKPPSNTSCESSFSSDRDLRHDDTFTVGAKLFKWEYPLGKYDIF